MSSTDTVIELGEAAITDGGGPEIETTAPAEVEADGADAPEVEAQPDEPDAEPAKAAEGKLPTPEQLAKSWEDLRKVQREHWREVKQFKDSSKAPADPSSPAEFAALLESKGISLEKLVDHMIESGGGQEKPPVAPEVAELQKWKADQESQRQQAQQDKEMQDARAALAAAASDASKEDGRYELLSHLGQGDATTYDRVIAKIGEHQREYGEVLPWGDAAASVEKELRTEAEKLIQTLRPIRAFAKYFQASDTTTDSAKPSARRTLTNKSVSGGANGNKPGLPLDPDARDAAIRARFFA